MPWLRGPSWTGRAIEDRFQGPQNVVLFYRRKRGVLWAIVFGYVMETIYRYTAARLRQGAATPLRVYDKVPDLVIGPFGIVVPRPELFGLTEAQLMKTVERFAGKITVTDHSI